MKGEIVEFISKQVITPSSPTPYHLGHYQLSLLDQKNPNVYVCMVYFFDRTSQILDPNEDISDKLKKSLSDVLSQYYPLAGRFTEEDSVDCNDEGVPYVEARARCQLSDFIKTQYRSELNKLVPYDIDALADLPLCVQLTFFDCGGVSIAAAISHRIGDGLSFLTFINTWATVARTDGEAEGTHNVKAHLISATLFPPKDMGSFDPNTFLAKEEIVSKRFVFYGTRIEALKSKFADAIPRSEKQKPPSRIEALSALIWSRFVSVTQSESSETQPLFVVSNAINLRPRMEPPLPDYSFGNYADIAITFLQVQKGEDCCYNFIKQVREQTKKIDKEYIEKLRENEHLRDAKELSLAYTRRDIRTFHFSSLCRFPLYDADFGWGRPIWVGLPAKKFRNTVTFMDTSDEGGIEAYISLAAVDMAKLQNDKEFRAYAASPVQSTNASQTLCC